MSIEKLLEENTAALNRNTEALLKAAGAPAGAASTAAATTTSTGGKKGKGAAAPKITQDQMNAAITKLKEKHGIEECRAIMDSVAGVKKLAEVKPEHYEAIYNAAVAKYDELEEGADEDEGGL